MSTTFAETIRVLQLERAAQQQKLADIDSAIASLQRVTGERSVDAATPTAAPQARRPGRRAWTPEQRARLSAAMRKSKAKRRPAAPAEPPAAARGAVHTPRAGMAAPAPRDVVAARDQAVLLRLQKGPASFSVLRDALPVEPELTDDQRTRACSNAIVRLRGRKQIQSADGGQWRLV